MTAVGMIWRDSKRSTSATWIMVHNGCANAGSSIRLPGERSPVKAPVEFCQIDNETQMGLAR